MARRSSDSCPCPVVQTPFHAEELVARYNAARQADRHHPVLLVGLFALDLMTIHPFIDGNGRATRALTNALLQDAGYAVTRYVSLQTLIAHHADAYYASLSDSIAGWHDGHHDPWPWLRFFAGVMRAAYEQFAQDTSQKRAGGTKQDRVRDYVLHHAPATFRIGDIRAALPGISDPTIRLVLDALKQAGRVESGSVGRGATWRRR